MRLILRLLINAAALWVAATLVDGVVLEGNWWSLLIIAVIFGVVNAVIRPIVKLFSLPLLFLTLGLFTILINTLMLYITSWLSSNLTINSFLGAILASIIISAVSFVLSWFLPDDRD